MMAMEGGSAPMWAFLVVFFDAPLWSADDAAYQEAGPTAGTLYFHKGKAASEAARKISIDNERSKIGIVFGPTDPETIERGLDLSNFAPPGQILIELTAADLIRREGVHLEIVEFGGAIQFREGKERIYLWVNPDRPIRPIDMPPPGNGLFIGRQREIDSLVNITSGPRIVTVHGGPGVGTTSLLRRFQHEFEDQYQNGAYFINLGDLQNGEVTLATICRRLEIHSTRGEDQLSKLVSTFQDMEALLIIDNCTAVIDHVGPIVATLASECTNVLILVGSKRRLNVPGESVFELGGLEVPSPHENWEMMRRYDAMALFEDRAAAAAPGFEIDEDNAADIAKICERLEGNPLAIEIIAAKMRTMSPKHVLSILSDLIGSSNTRLGEAIGWWIKQLPQRAQLLLPRLTVFNGAFSIGWVARVCADSYLSRDFVYAAFEELKDSAFLRSAGSKTGELMLYLTETIRPFAKQSFKGDPAAETIKKNHRAWCLELAHEAEEGLLSPDQERWLRVMDAAYGDMRSVMNEARLVGGDLSLSARILIACHPYLYERNYFNEGLATAEKLLKIKDAERLPEYARLLNMAGAYASMLSRWKAAEKYGTKSYKLAIKRGDEHQTGRSSCTIAMAYEGLGEFEKARPYFLESYRLLRGKGADEELNAIANLLGNEANLGLFEEAMTHYYAGQAIRGTCKDPSTIASFVLNACHLAVMSSRWMEAGRLLVDGLEYCVDLDDRRNIGLGMRSASRIVAAWQHYEDAAIFIGAADSLLSHSESKPPVWSDDFFADAVKVARANLDAATYKACYLEGSMMESHEMLERLRQIVDERS